MIGSVRQMPEDAISSPRPNGVFPSQAISAVLRDGGIDSDEDIAAEQVQPSSLDLRLGSIAYRVQASSLPGPETLVGDKIRDFEMHAIDLTDGAVLEKGCVYIVPLMERLRLSERVSAFANPKSSTGRLDVFTRLITDRARRFDLVGPGYQGPLYAEVSPRTFSILVRAGSCLTQLRLRRGTSAIGPDELLRLHQAVGLVDTKIDRQEVREHDSISLRLDLAGATENGLVGYRAKNILRLSTLTASTTTNRVTSGNRSWRERGAASFSTLTISTFWRPAKRSRCRPFMPPRWSPTTLW